VARYWLDDPGIEPHWGAKLSAPALGSIQPPIEWVPGLSRTKTVGAWPSSPTPSSVEVNEILDIPLFVLLTQYCAGDKIEKNEMGWACGAYG